MALISSVSSSAASRILAVSVKRMSNTWVSISRPRSVARAPLLK